MPHKLLLPGAAGAAGGGFNTNDPIVTGGAASDIAGLIRIDGMSGSPDIRVGAANDDEFNQNTSGAPAGWSSFGAQSPTLDTNTAKSQFHVSVASQGGDAWNGILKAAPSIPYTVTAKISDTNLASGSAAAGLIVLDANTTNKVLFIGQAFSSNTLRVLAAKYTNWTTFSALVTAAITQDLYLNDTYVRMVVNAANNVDLYYSRNGYSWIKFAAAVNFLANATFVGLGVSPNGATTEMFADWIRFS